jgi:hypothetical protein
MSTLARKNLIVDADAVAALARARGTSESEAVRYAVAQALAAEDTIAALEELHQLGAFADTPRTRHMYGAIPLLDAQTRGVEPQGVTQSESRRVRATGVKRRQSRRTQPATRAS